MKMFFSGWKNDQDKDKIVQKIESGVEVTDLTLTEKGLHLIIIDGELDSNEVKRRKLINKKRQIEQALRDVNVELVMIEKRQTALHTAAAKIQLLPDNDMKMYTSKGLTA